MNKFLMSNKLSSYYSKRVNSFEYLVKNPSEKIHFYKNVRFFLWNAAIL